MSPWFLALLAGLLVAFIQYGWRELRSGWATIPARCCALARSRLVVALLLDAPAARAKPVGSLGRARRVDQHGTGRQRDLARVSRFAAARRRRIDVRVRRLDSAHDASSAPPIVFDASPGGRAGASARDIRSSSSRTESSMIRTRCGRCPPGSRVVLLPHRAAARPRRRLARCAARRRQRRHGRREDWRRAAGAPAHAPARSRSRSRESQSRPRPIDSLPPFGERSVVGARSSSRAPADRLLRAAVTSPEDAERRNDTLSALRSTCRAPRARCSSRRRPISTRDMRSPCCADRWEFQPAVFFAWLRGSGASKDALTPIPEADVRQACAKRRSRSFTATPRRLVRLAR